MNDSFENYALGALLLLVAIDIAAWIGRLIFLALS
jgi:hypothetical protein